MRVARDGATVRSVGKPSVRTTSHVIYGRTKSTAPPRRPASPVRPLRRRVPAQRRRRHSVAMPRLSFLWRERAWVRRWSCYAWKCLERSPSTGRDDASLVLLSGLARGRVREPLRCQGGPEQRSAARVVLSPSTAFHGSRAVRPVLRERHHLSPIGHRRVARVQRLRDRVRCRILVHARPPRDRSHS